MIGCTYLLKSVVSVSLAYFLFTFENVLKTRNALQHTDKLGMNSDSLVTQQVPSTLVCVLLLGVCGHRWSS